MNFCDPVFQCKIKASKPAIDGFEVENLVNGSRKGFICERFTRPPVDIEIEFLTAINISHIVIHPNVNSYKSIGFIILSHLDSGRSRNNAEPAIHVPIGRGRVGNEEVLIFKNNSYRHTFAVPPPHVPDGKRNAVFTLRYAHPQPLKCTRSVVVSVVQTATTGPAALRSVEVWGQPAVPKSPNDVISLMTLWKGRRADRCELPCKRVFYGAGEVTESVKPDSVQKCTNTEAVAELALQSMPSGSKEWPPIPEDFLDPLTCHIMAVPMMLPSGSSIDLSSLERHTRSENTWGRPPCDPFTGVPFQGSSHPVANVILKTRIDRFLLLNGDHPDVLAAGRTTGPSPTTLTRETTRNAFLPHTGASKPKGPRQSDATEWSVASKVSGCVSYNCGTREDAPSSSQVPTAGSVPGGKMPCSCSLMGKTLRSVKKCSCGGVGVVASVSQMPFVGGHDAQQSSSKGSHSLVHALKRSQQHLLRGMHTAPYLKTPGSNSATSRQFPKMPSCSCGTCGPLYRMSCVHLICRKCLLSEQSFEVTCPICSSQTPKSAVSRQHPA